ncbi:S100P-binding protein isoform X2 [Protobothrops mucrosquamatus]|uniref:S100P-binding protein isoform X2 n=1 Tax=Protobothrops mucrosquamatus TaxID=103944 RepID=UPI0010FAFC55|nr:S100P-binding protein isoform X2 [Protobothrops mucrosquamatus]
MAAGSGSKRHLEEECEEGGAADAKRQCCRTCSLVKPKRILIQEADLESRKARYVNAVLSHASSVPSLIDPVHELHILVDTVASESSYDHPTDLTVRNYSKRSHSKTQRFSLSQWVERSKRNFGRFDGLPDRFERSPTLS